jgi:hypothetical protein
MVRVDLSRMIVVLPWPDWAHQIKRSNDINIVASTRCGLDQRRLSSLSRHPQRCLRPPNRPALLRWPALRPLGQPRLLTPQSHERAPTLEPAAFFIPLLNVYSFIPHLFLIYFNILSLATISPHPRCPRAHCLLSRYLRASPLSQLPFAQPRLE